MATISLLGTATFNTSSGTKTVTATPTDGDLILVVAAHTGNTLISCTDNQSGGSYWNIVSALKVSSADQLTIYAREALITSATAVSTIYTVAPGTTTGGGLAVLRVTGMSRFGSRAARQYGVQENQASGTPTVALTQAALTDSCLIGAVFNGASPAAMNPRTSPLWTERFDNGYATPTTGLEIMTIDSGETASSIAWANSSASAFCAMVIELNTAPLVRKLSALGVGGNGLGG